MNQAESRPQLHVTALDTFARCGEQFRQRYILGKRRPPGVFLIVGSGTHQSADENLKTKMETGSLLSIDQVTDIARDYVDREFAGEVDLSEEERSAGKQAVAGEAKDKAVRLAACHALAVAPKLEPKSVERGFSVTLDGFLEARGIEMELDLVGRIDLETKDDAIRDIKTSRSKPDANAAEISTQLAAYSTAKRVIDGEHASGLTLDYLVDYKSGAQHIPISAPPIGDHRQAALLNRIAAVANAMKKGVFPPVEPGHWMCSRRWCGYYDECPYTANPTSMLVKIGGAA